MTHEPTHGYTNAGTPVHGHRMDHHRTDTAYQRFNKRAAEKITSKVGTMTCAWVFCLLALCSLPAILSQFHLFAHTFPDALVRVSIIALVSWIAQSFLQLVLLPAIMVGQNLQGAASDARATKTFEDTEEILKAVKQMHSEIGPRLMGKAPCRCSGCTKPRKGGW